MLGFGLVEVMISIAIIGILCGMVVPSLFPVNEYQSIRDQRNAQEIASICAAAQAAGLNFIVPGDLDATVANVLRGGMPASGAFKGRKFIVSGISDQENVREAMRYLRLVDDTLQYNEKAPSNAIASNEGGGTSNT